MGAIESLKKGFEVAKKLVPLMCIVFGFNFGASGLMLSIVGVNPMEEKVREVLGLLLIIFGATFVMWIFLEGGLFSCINSYIKTGEDKIDTFVGSCAKFFGRLLGVNLLSGIIVGSLFFIGAIITAMFIAMGHNKNPFFNAIGLIIFGVIIIISMVVSLILLLSHYIIVLHDKKIIESVKDALEMFKNNIWMITKLFVSFIVIFLSMSLLLRLLGVIFVKILPIGMTLGITNIFFTSVANAFLSIFTSATLVVFIL